MSVIPTREEDDFEGLVVTLLNCEADAAWHKRCGTYDDATIAAMERRDEAWTAVFAAYDAQAAEIRLVRERNAELAAQRLEADDRAYYEGRIAELEDALGDLGYREPERDGNGFPCCESCGECGPTVGFGPDPYAQEINDDLTPVWQCAHCSYEHAQDI